MRRAAPGAAVVILAALFAAAAFVNNPAHITCNSEVMRQGDTCTHVTGTSTWQTSYDQEQQGVQRNRLTFSALAGLLAVAAGLLFLIRRSGPAGALPDAELKRPVGRRDPGPG